MSRRTSAKNGKSASVREISTKISRIQIASSRRPSAGHFSIDQFVESIKARKFKRIVVLAGAGISTPSGIPDFRTPGTGLYDNLQRYNIPYPEAIFELKYFHRNPQPFFHLAKELYPGRYLPNLIHYFIRYLHDEKMLHRVYTQNIDGLERMCGIPAEKIVEAHGTFVSATCLRCRQKYRSEEIREKIFQNEIPRCTKTNRCLGIVKPDIVFFGEDLPRRFELYVQDMPFADCCIVMGTSLAVYPFADIVDSTVRSTPRLLINRHVVGTFLTPRPLDLTLIGDLEFNIKHLLDKLDLFAHISELMKRENSQQQIQQRLALRPTTAKTNVTNQRLQQAEQFLEEQRQTDGLVKNRRDQQTQFVQKKTVLNDKTKSLIEKHNNSLIFQRRRSKSALPVARKKELSSSSSSSSNSLNSSISDQDLSPFAFKPSSKSETQRNLKPIALAASRVRTNPLLTATLRTAQ